MALATLPDECAAGRVIDPLAFAVQRVIDAGEVQSCYEPEFVRRVAASSPEEQFEVREKLRMAYGKNFRVREFNRRIKVQAWDLLQPMIQPPLRKDVPVLLDQHLNDHGNAERLIAISGNDLRYCHDFKKWLVWDGRRWEIDQTGKARKLAIDAMVEFFRQADASGNDLAAKFARASLDNRRVRDALAMAEPQLAIRPSELDAKPHLLNCQNGTVDLSTSELRPHERGDYITKLVHFSYRPEAKCPRWDTFLDEVMGGGPDASEGALERAQRLVEYLQRALGYSLTGVTSEKAVFVLFGEGDNGKSTMLTAFREIIDEYSVLLQADTLMARQESNNTQADLADLRGARFAQTSETEEGQRLSRSKLKRITQGMGKIKAARKYENMIEFIETHKLWMDTNRKPVIRDADDKATFNRLHPIPFTVRIPPDRIDRTLPAKLEQEAEGILVWAIIGAQRWYTGGLGRPPEVDAARQEWQSESDKLGRFIEERCIDGDSLRVRTSDLYAAYRSWAEQAGEKNLLSSSDFHAKVQSRGLQKKHTERGDFYLKLGRLFTCLTIRSTIET